MIQAEAQVASIHNALANSTGPGFFSPDINRETQIPLDGWYTNTSVSFVAQSFRAVRITHEDAAGLAVISKLLRSLFLHREIREKGGAYGGFALYNSEEGLFSFASYRDPHIKQTLDVYTSACDFIKGGSYSQTDVKEAVLQVCSDIDKPDTPGPEAMKAFYRDITHLSDDIRKQFKDRLLNLDKKQIQEIAGRYFTADNPEQGTAVISGKAALEDAARQLEKEGKSMSLFRFSPGASILQRLQEIDDCCIHAARILLLDPVPHPGNRNDLFEIGHGYIQIFPGGPVYGPDRIFLPFYEKGGLKDWRAGEKRGKFPVPVQVPVPVHRA